jgi:hypothetical protein
MKAGATAQLNHGGPWLWVPAPRAQLRTRRGRQLEKKSYSAAVTGALLLAPYFWSM